MTPSTDQLKEQMRQAMRRLGASVTVITSFDGDRKYAMTATAVTSLSMDPMALLVCVNRETGLYQALSQGHGYCVNILFEDQQDISNLCASEGAGEAKFNLGQWQSDDGNMPYLANAQASLFCDSDGNYDYGSHTIFIGKIRRVITRDDIAPLMFLDGEYISSTP